MSKSQWFVGEENLSIELRILVVGSDKIFAIENFYVKYLRMMGVEVNHLSTQSIFSDYYNRNVFNKVSFKLGLSKIYEKINICVNDQIRSQRPDVIWIFKGMEIFQETLKYWKRQGIRLVNYNPDNPFLFSGKGSGNENITNSIAWYDLHFTYSQSIAHKIDKDFSIPTSILPFGFDVADSIVQQAIQDQEILKTCFLGNPDTFRASFITQLASRGIPVAVYGHHWSRFVRHANIEIHGPVYEEEQWRVLRKYRIQLNIMRPHNLDSHNMRTFEVPGIGGIMLAPVTPDHRAFFEEGREAFFYQSPDDCAVHIHELMEMSHHEVDAVRHLARARSLHSGYHYKDRAATALEAIKGLFNA